MSVNRDEDRLLDHQYDGIQEYDNPMPRWWLWLLWISIIWGVAYWANLIPGVGEGKGWHANYESEMAAAEARFAPKPSGSDAVAAVVTDSTIQAATEDDRLLALGRETFVSTCASCHREDGGGSIGPNLTDDYWLHGARPLDVHGVVLNGVLDKGMPGWGSLLTPEQSLAVSAHVLTLRGTEPKEAKAPQGVRFDADADPEDESTHGSRDH